MRLWGAVGAAFILLEGAAGAYDQPVHVYLSSRAYAGPKTLDAGGGAAAVTALRERIYNAGANAADAKLRARFLARYPDVKHFDAWELKRFLALNPDMHVAGLDETALPEGADGAQVYAQASRLPDDDHRNRDRFRHDGQRHVMFDPFGHELPDDPATLEMGGLTGLSSQAHAHYGLPKLEFSDDPEVLKKDPRRFAVPPTVHTFGADFVEVYTALAILAARLPGGERLALVHAGAAAHHLEDVANQIHTVQVGLYDFFVDAKIESYKEELRSAGGLLRSRPTFVQIGIDIIANHHVLAEVLYARHLLAPGDPVRALTESAAPDAELDRQLAGVPADCAPGFAHRLADVLIDRSSYEGSPVYAATRAVASPRLSRVGQHFDETEDPDRHVRPGADLSPLFDLEARGARRSDQVLRAWWSRFAACRSAPASVETSIAEHLIANRLDALDDAEARARAWVPKAPEREKLNVWVPAGYLLALIALAWVGRRIVRGRSGKKG
ncbi:MAG TPA: hypothetical protein VFF06_25005 [Polyangia bacterium]|nr:hypothetical protein [Polyangia bacterium]